MYQFIFNKYFLITIPLLGIFLQWANVGFAVEKASEPDKKSELSALLPSAPSIAMVFNDASLISKIVYKNQWFESFLESNLYRGAVEDLGPVFLINGDNLKNAWTGRLIDFLSNHFLKDEPVQLYYFAKDRLVSPFAVAIPNINDTKMKVVSGISEKLLQSEVQQEMFDSSDQLQKKSFLVRPLHLHSEKFATYREGNCLSIARDPRVSISAGLACSSLGTESTEEVILKVRLDHFFPQIWAFASKFYGLENEFTVNFKYKSWDKNLQVRDGLIKIREGFSIAKSKVSPAIFNLLPAQTAFFATFSIPLPEALDDGNIKTFLASNQVDIHKKPIHQVTLAAWNRRGAKSGTTHVTAVLIQDNQAGGLSLEGLPKIFSEKTLAEIKFDRICESYLVLTPYLEALEDLRQGCSKSIPVLSHKSPGILKSFEGAESSAQVYFDLGGLLADSLKVGIERSKEKGVLESPEVIQSLQLLGRLPAFGFQGKFQDGTLKFVEVL